MVKTIILGTEFDNILLEKLRKVLLFNNVTLLNEKWSLAGSQELSEYEFTFKNETIKIEVETYIGISIIGDEKIVDFISESVKN